ncbi:unnamed protein product [Schistosoma bovis]|nr:unnamed protein product [Schistosoma bovis]
MATFCSRKVKQNGLPRSILVLLLIDGYIAFAIGGASWQKPNELFESVLRFRQTPTH